MIFKSNIALFFIFLACIGAGALQKETKQDLPAAKISDYALEVYPDSVPFRIINPQEGSELPPLKSSFVYGSANPLGELFINGKSVPVYYTGGFLSMIDYSSGPFTINAELRTATTVQYIKRRVFVEGPPVQFPQDRLAIENLQPDSDITMLPPDSVTVSFRGTPGKNSYFQVKGIRKKIPVSESREHPGYYRGELILQPSNRLNNAAVKVSLYDMKTGKKTSAQCRGKITSLPADVPWIVEVSSENASLRAGPSNTSYDKAGYVLFPPVGTRLRVTGSRGQELKIRLSANKYLWISRNDVKQMPAGTPCEPTFAGNISISEKGRSTIISLPLHARLPFEITPSINGDNIEVSIFGVYSNTDWINYQASTRVVKNLQWFQDDSETYRISINTGINSWWGYDSRYEGTTFILELRSPPETIDNNFPLKGLLVAIDAGHSADDRGAVGPTGTLEKDVNLSISKILEKILIEEGAQAILIRKNDEQTGLYERPKKAWEAGADILVSIHNNALPEGDNPFERNGFGIYYFQPYSLALAREIHRSYSEFFGKAGILNDDGLHYGNLALARPTQFPSVLVESAYLMIPREEALLNSIKFRYDCAGAIVSGLRKYIIGMVSHSTP